MTQTGGYATGFVEHGMTSLMPELKCRDINVVTNAGGASPLTCKAMLEAVAAGASIGSTASAPRRPTARTRSGDKNNHVYIGVAGRKRTVLPASKPR